MNALICDLKRFAAHDGPGLRSTLFLKGCSLHCRWCHNPESVRRTPELGFFPGKCALCGECAKVCSCHGIVDGKHLFDRARCKACGRCVDACLFDALELYGREISPEEAAKELLEDKDFYEVSGGGVTLSGGEPLLQIDFCAELLRTMKREHVSAAVETCGNVPWSYFEKIMPFVDIFLYDFKHFDSDEHKKLTGCGNELIKSNLLKLSKTGVPIEIRMPLAPGLNMDDATIRKSGEFLSALENIQAVRLLACHSLARTKAEAVGMDGYGVVAKSPDAEALEHVAGILRDCGLVAINSLG